jgi:hypothetical protein
VWTAALLNVSLIQLFTGQESCPGRVLRFRNGIAASKQRSQRRGVLVGPCTGEEKVHLTPPLPLDAGKYLQLAL